MRTAEHIAFIVEVFLGPKILTRIASYPNRFLPEPDMQKASGFSWWIS